MHQMLVEAPYKLRLANIGVVRQASHPENEVQGVAVATKRLIYLIHLSL